MRVIFLITSFVMLKKILCLNNIPNLSLWKFPIKMKRD